MIKKQRSLIRKEIEFIGRELSHEPKRERKFDLYSVVDFYIMWEFFSHTSNCRKKCFLPFSVCWNLHRWTFTRLRMKRNKTISTVCSVTLRQRIKFYRRRSKERSSSCVRLGWLASKRLPTILRLGRRQQLENTVELKSTRSAQQFAVLTWSRVSQGLSWCINWKVLFWVFLKKEKRKNFHVCLLAVSLLQLEGRNFSTAMWVINTLTVIGKWLMGHDLWLRNIGLLVICGSSWKGWKIETEQLGNG